MGLRHTALSGDSMPLPPMPEPPEPWRCHHWLHDKGMNCQDSVRGTGEACRTCEANPKKDAADYHMRWRQWERDYSAWLPPDCTLPPDQWTMKEVRYAKQIREAIEDMSEEDCARCAEVSPTLWPLLMQCLDDLRTWEAF